MPPQTDYNVIVPGADQSTNNSSGNAIAAVATCGYFGFLVGPPAIGFLAQAAGLRAALLLILALSLLAAARADHRQGLLG